MLYGKFPHCDADSSDTDIVVAITDFRMKIEYPDIFDEWVLRKISQNLKVLPINEDNKPQKKSVTSVGSLIQQTRT